MENTLAVIEHPVITERATQLKAKGNQYVFRVALAATKDDIRRAVERLFKVKVVRVNTMRMPGKFRRMGRSAGAHRPDWKKAIVTLQAGQEIQVMDEGQ